VSNVVSKGCGRGGCLDSQTAQGGGRTKAEAAKELFLSGCNCSQAVFCAFAGDYGLDADVASKVSCGLGGGVGRMREVCGAVGGAALVFGLEYGEDKMRTYAEVQEFCAAFKRETGSIICRELLEGAQVAVETGGSPEARTESYYRKRPCAELVEIAAAILDEMLKKGKTEK
jgi:C_GCAxxG_C_C family probable redox protein